MLNKYMSDIKIEDFPFRESPSRVGREVANSIGSKGGRYYFEVLTMSKSIYIELCI